MALVLSLSELIKISTFIIDMKYRKMIYFIKNVIFTQLE